MHPAPAPLPTAITSRRGEPPTRTSFLVVGTGWRAEPYLRLAAMLPDRFRVTGIVAHSEASQERARRDWGVEVHADLDAALAAERPDFVVLSVPWPVTPVLVRRLVELDLPVLTETPPAPDLDGLFVASDPMAVGALAALRAAGRRVPDDVAVVGFDDAAVAQTCDPPLTTVAQPLPEMARLMTDLLVARIEGAAGADDHRVVPTTLVRRASG